MHPLTPCTLTPAPPLTPCTPVTPSQVMHFEEEVGTLEQERLKLKKRLGVQAINRGERAALLEISVEKLTALEEMEVP